MGIIIGSARHDENGKYINGQAGDQTGQEVSTQNFYVHSKGWDVLRPKSSITANVIGSNMYRACGNPNIGYCQGHRSGIITYGIDTTTPTECDCSSLVRQCVKEATGIDAGNFTTANEKEKLLATGLFEYVGQYQSDMNLYKGDILVTCTKGHTVIVISSDYVRENSPTTTIDNTPENVINYLVGKNYTLQVELKVRTGAGTSYRAKKHSELTVGGKAHDNDNDGALDKGTVVTCKKITQVGDDIWMLCPSGWIAAYYQGHKYVS